ncbi:hypothetical protein M404DRAFT_1002736 [Pisolithus tinctorius Marx 270]|uniref:Uncharacterized protein n=1 Tax=Pisolithus tinctorius Marx 270 TaxID=870435 RepID=A0A0C3P3W9_PISTI|nr:hypothetical protein M404DRAFT_1002736 [Pisolithus tinctorius Marx 270]
MGIILGAAPSVPQSPYFCIFSATLNSARSLVFVQLCPLPDSPAFSLLQNWDAALAKA